MVGTYHEMFNILGEPIEPFDQDKMTVEWRGLIKNMKWTVYDYNSGGNYKIPIKHRVLWSVGAHSSYAAHCFMEWFYKEKDRLAELAENERKNA